MHTIGGRVRAERGVCGGQMREAGMMRSLREKGALHAVNAAIASRVMCGLATLRRQRSRRAHAVCDLHVCACVDRPRTNMQCDRCVHLPLLVLHTPPPTSRYVRVCMPMPAPILDLSLGHRQIRFICHLAHLLNGMPWSSVVCLISLRVACSPRCLDSETQAHLRAPEVFGVLAKVAV